MPLPSLTIIHYTYPILLSLPLPFLLTPVSPPPPPPPGLIPITVQRISPRRTLILTLLALLAFTSFLDVTVLVANVLSARVRYGDDLPLYLTGAQLGGEITYALGGLVAWGVALIACLWRNKFSKSLAVLASLGAVGEIVNLVWLVKREVHTGNSEKLFAILSFIPSSSRLLILPLLFLATLSPRVSYEPSDERSGLLAADSATNGRLLEPGTSGAYGTFATGATTPANPPQPEEQTEQQRREERAKQTKIKLTKALGSRRQPKKVLSWSEGWPKFKKLIPTLWPSTSRKLQVYVIITGVLILIQRFLNPLSPITLGWLVEALSSWRHPSDVWKALGAYLAVRMVNSYDFISIAQQYFWIPVVQYTDREMQMICFNHLLDLSLSYHTRRNTGEVMRIIDRGSAINELFRTILFSVVPTLSDTVIGFSVFIWLFGPWITFGILAIMIPYCIFSILATRYSQKYRREYIDTDVRQRGIVSDVLTNWESVKYFTSERREVARFEEAVDEVMKVDYQWRMGLQVIYGVQSLLLVTAFAIGAILLSVKIMHGQANAATFVVYITYFGQFTQPLNQLSSLYKNISSDIIDAEKMLSLLGEKTEIKDDPDAKEMVITDGVIEFKNVTFSYDGTKDAIRNVSFKLEKGQSLALVGETGSGKSTILRLLYRFYDITSGHIYIDGQDISKVTQESLRRAIGIVPQDSVLWNDTIAANIAYGKPDASDEEIIEAAKAGRIHDKVMTFEDQYDTIVGERGVRLSGGEKQRVSLARMFLKSPFILVLDEATSALDTETEREIQKSLSNLAKGRTSLSIAHRLSTIINSDKIMVMKEGQILEIGGYKELIEKNGAFARMWKRQIYTEAELLEGDAIDKFASALPTADDFKAFRKEEYGEEKPQNGESDNSEQTVAATSDSSKGLKDQGGHRKGAEPSGELANKPGYQVDTAAPADQPGAESFAEVVKSEPHEGTDKPATYAEAAAELSQSEETDDKDKQPVSSEVDGAVTDGLLKSPKPERDNGRNIDEGLAPESSEAGDEVIDERTALLQGRDPIEGVETPPAPAGGQAAEQVERAEQALAPRTSQPASIKTHSGSSSRKEKKKKKNRR
ncbi:ABC transporter [Cryptococcus deuterogattii LA55]|nr:ABC transporter [Cryptococcus deuterogattii LA55]KIR71558.1 ABC transporter [Cryptococcus deuterogattii CA1014]KIR91139.1 ABC transporter [Cryptococcus deuterogattii CBS 10090]